MWSSRSYVSENCLIVSWNVVWSASWKVYANGSVTRFSFTTGITGDKWGCESSPVWMLEGSEMAQYQRWPEMALVIPRGVDVINQLYLFVRDVSTYKKWFWGFIHDILATFEGIIYENPLKTTLISVRISLHLVSLNSWSLYSDKYFLKLEFVWSLEHNNHGPKHTVLWLFNKQIKNNYNNKNICKQFKESHLQAADNQIKESWEHL